MGSGATVSPPLSIWCAATGVLCCRHDQEWQAEDTRVDAEGAWCRGARGCGRGHDLGAAAGAKAIWNRMSSHIT